LNPISNPADWKQIISQSPVLQQETKTLDYAWWGGIAAGGKQIEKFGTLATGEFDVLPGSYELSTTWDDAVRVYLDGRLVVDEWNPSKYTFDESPNKAIRLQLNGHHSLRVEHVELGGFATLSLKLRKL
jgi:alpha-L-fucosidase